MSRVNRVTDVLSIGSSAGYILFVVIMHVLLLFTIYRNSHTHMHIYIVIYITLVFWIKLKLILLNFLTGAAGSQPNKVLLLELFHDNEGAVLP
jgi:hypothetical protein